MNDDIPQQIEHRCQSVTHPLSKRFCESFPLRKQNIYPLETKLTCEGKLPPPPPHGDVRGSRGWRKWEILKDSQQCEILSLFFGEKKLKDMRDLLKVYKGIINSDFYRDFMYSFRLLPS